MASDLHWEGNVVRTIGGWRAQVLAPWTTRPGSACADVSWFGGRARGQQVAGASARLPGGLCRVVPVFARSSPLGHCEETQAQSCPPKLRRCFDRSSRDGTESVSIWQSRLAWRALPSSPRGLSLGRCRRSRPASLPRASPRPRSCRGRPARGLRLPRGLWRPRGREATIRQRAEQLAAQVSRRGVRSGNPSELRSSRATFAATLVT